MHPCPPLSALLALAAAALAAEAPLPLTSTVGLTAAAADGRHWAYVLWQPAGPEGVEAGQVAVYQKAGAAGSPSPYQRVSVTGPHSDPAVIATALHRGAQLGADPDRLVAALDAGFRDLLEGALGLANEEKVAIAIAGALGDPERTRLLLVLARQHPALAIALGQAWAGEVGKGIKTFEVRRFNPATGQDGTVIGRVTVDPATPLALPAPGPAVHVPDPSPTGHLNVHLRWATPGALRDLSLLQFGFNLYRVDRARAEALGWHTGPPPAAAMRDLCANEPESARRVNRRPVITDRDLSELEAADPADTATFFAIDDNRRFQDDGADFPDGGRYYYYVTALDLLGREGALSDPTPVTVYSRLPPLPPRELQVENEIVFTGAARDHRLRLTWTAPPPQHGIQPAAFLVYRWDSINDIARLGREIHPTENRPHVNLIAIVPAVPGQDRCQFADDGTVTPPAWADVRSPRPLMASHLGRTFYYTVRTVDAAACGGNVSGNSSPAWGVLRDNVGPAGPLAGSVLTVFYQPSVAHTSTTPFADPAFNAGDVLVELETHAASNGLAWAEFLEQHASDPPVPIGRVPFATAGAARVATLAHRRTRSDEAALTYSCRVTTASGDTSAAAAMPSPIGAPAPGIAYAVRFDATVSEETRVNAGPHNPRNPDDDTTNPITGSLELPADARQWRVYQRVDDAPLALVAQGVVSAGNTTVQWSDAALPASWARLCYYGQAFDEHGNPGPLWRIVCIDSGSPLNLPAPMLATPTGRGNQASPEMEVRWFCPPAGVERFEVWIASGRGARPPADSGPQLSGDLASHPNLLPDHPDLDFGVFDTALVRSMLPAGRSDFACQVPVELNQDCTVLVRAVGPGSHGQRIAGNFSAPQSFCWVAQQDSFSEDVPWPARPLPPVTTAFHEGIGLRFLATEIPEWQGVGVRVGRATDEFNPDPVLFDPIPVPGYLVDSHTNPLDYVFRREQAAQGEAPAAAPGSLFPMMLFRMQVPNSLFPEVSGDLVQVSPLMETIAYEERTLGGRPTVVIWDRHVALLPPGGIPAADAQRDLYVLDRHPLLAGARYRYLVVRYGPDREIERVIPAGEIEIPST